jgi:hypothetical protein
VLRTSCEEMEKHLSIVDCFGIPRPSRPGVIDKYKLKADLQFQLDVREMVDAFSEEEAELHGAPPTWAVLGTLARLCAGVGPKPLEAKVRSWHPCTGCSGSSLLNNKYRADFEVACAEVDEDYGAIARHFHAQYTAESPNPHPSWLSAAGEFGYISMWTKKFLGLKLTEEDDRYEKIKPSLYIKHTKHTHI